MKKGITLLLILSLLLTFAACGKKAPVVQPDQTDAPDTQPQQTVTEPTEPAPTWMTFPADRQLTARQYFVFDCENGEFLTISGAEDERIYPASITKLFTAYVANQFLHPDKEITVNKALEYVYAGSSLADLKKDDVVTTRRLVEGMLLPSGNDAAYILAAAAGRELLGESQAGAALAVEAFVEEMNRQAEEQGLTGTHFENPDGYHADSHYSCPRDLAVMGKLALEDPVIARYVRCRSDAVRFASGETCTWNNSNRLLNPNSQYYCSSAIGLKTGHTKQAGYCLLAAFETDAGDILVGIFGAADSLSRYSDAVALMELATAAQPNSF